MHDYANFNKQNKLLGMCHINNHAQRKLPPCNAAIERAPAPAATAQRARTRTFRCFC